MLHYYSDGGRKVHFEGRAKGDCVTRAVAIAMNRPYLDVYQEILEVCKNTRTSCRPNTGIDTSIDAFRNYMQSRGFRLVHERATLANAPKGRVIAKMSPAKGRKGGHYTALINSAIYDTFNPTTDKKLNQVADYFWIFEGAKQSQVSY
jgi:hypothetical protein